MMQKKVKHRVSREECINFIQVKRDEELISDDLYGTSDVNKRHRIPVMT